MPKLFRPYVPIAVRCQVAERQARMFSPHPGLLVRECGETFGTRLKKLLGFLSACFGCEVKDLRLDHDPPLALRDEVRHGGMTTLYIPDANDPEHLAYRPHGAQFEGSHDIKTRVRGDHGQFSDIALIKRQRRRERPPKAKKKWASRPFPKRKKI